MLEATGGGGVAWYVAKVSANSVSSQSSHMEKERGEIVLNFQALDQQIFLSNPSNNIDVN
jgi:hypothetical protein